MGNPSSLIHSGQLVNELKAGKQPFFSKSVNAVRLSGATLYTDVHIATRQSHVSGLLCKIKE
jgi:hypothetical protein